MMMSGEITEECVEFRSEVRPSDDFAPHGCGGAMVVWCDSVIV